MDVIKENDVPPPSTTVAGHYISSVGGAQNAALIIEDPSPRSNRHRSTTGNDSVISIVSLDSNFNQLRVSSEDSFEHSMPLNPAPRLSTDSSLTPLPGAEDSSKHIVPVDLGPDVHISNRLNTLKQMEKAFFFQLNWGPVIAEADKDLCVNIMQHLLSKMDAASRAEVCQRICPSRKRRAIDLTEQQQYPTKQRTQHSRFTQFFRDNIQQSTDTGTDIPTACTAMLAKQPRGVDNNTIARLDAVHLDTFSAVTDQSNFDERRPTCPLCSQTITVQRQRLYTHRHCKGAYYIIYQCCGREFSHLASLKGCKIFDSLQPAQKLIEWKFVRNKWRLNGCRGRDWTRCQHCEAIFAYYSGKNAYHTKSECPYFSNYAQTCEEID